MYRTLTIDVLEARALPSHAISTVPLAIAAVSHAAPPSQSLSGHASGNFSTSVPAGDAGSVYTFSGTGNIAKLGKIQVFGSIMAVGDEMHGHAQGTITFSGDKGSLTLAVTGPKQHFFAPLPTKFQYHVYGGTGVGQALQVQGTLTINLVGLAPPAGSRDRFQMTMH
jgi:hypothetical protein